VAFPLAVSAQSEIEIFAIDSAEILEEIRKVHKDLADACELVSTELVRISTCWTERWSACLEEASRLFFVAKDIPAMIALLQTAHKTLSRTPETPSEKAFVRLYGTELQQAWIWVSKYLQDNESTGNFYLDQAWKIYYAVFLRIHKSVDSMTSFSLSESSPLLRSIHQSPLAVPGGSGNVSIHSIGDRIAVLNSKQRPRVVVVLGSDGRSFKYLLKGNEDLKQDERVMQLFKLMNSVIAQSVMYRRRSGVFPTTPGIETLENFQIRRYAVVPLSNNAGLIEWVPGCDTLHSLIKTQRESNKVPLSIEHNLMRSVHAKYEDLDSFSRIEIFRYALSNTSGNELRHIMWTHAGSAEVWCKQRLMYSRSLAVMSIVGYILGLGDRHPSNVMIEQATGQVIHVDFGDCFEVASMREKYPERIPFRLTRQLIYALEPSGIEGTFRITAERVMDIVRKNADTIMAMLEAFVYDPLITWRLLPHMHNSSNPSTPADVDKLDLTSRAKLIVRRVRDKLLGDDQTIPAHVDLLIREATAHENLSSMYLGYCAFW
jgi:serine/threonine-protein kinase mTOR